MFLIDATLQVFELSPSEQAGLQAVDYFTWALQRLYERHEERYVKYLGDAIRVVLDLDDKRKAGYGRYYTRKKRIVPILSPEGMKEKSQGYRIARTAAHQSHGMEPNFIHWLRGIINV